MSKKKTNSRGFTLIELLTVIAILAVILLISIPVILGVLDNARKNSFKNQVLLYVEALKQQTSMALMGSGYSELKSVDNSFYAPTNDSDNKLVRVSVSNLNKVMDNVALTNDDDKYFYVEYTESGYNYYIGEGVRKEGEFSTTCDNTCVTKIYNNEEIRLINFKTFTTSQIVRGDTEVSSNPSEPSTPSEPVVDTTKPEVSVSVSGTTATLTLSDNVGIAAYCITTSDNSGSCGFVETSETTITRENMTDGTYYAFAKDTSNNISESVEFSILVISGSNGQEVSLGGYNWHIIGQNDTKIWLLMDAGQLDNKAHCTDDTDETTDCGVYTLEDETKTYQYSWDKSLIRKYLNSEFYNTLITNDNRIASKIISTKICNNKSVADKNNYTYGGYTEEEINNLESACEFGYSNDNIRLITPSEFHNLTPYFQGVTYPSIDSHGDSYGLVKTAEVNYITRLSENDWLYGTSADGIGLWWTTGTASYSDSSGFRRGIDVYTNGSVLNNSSHLSYGVRPVIVLKK